MKQFSLPHQVSATVRVPSTSNRRATWRKRNCFTKEALKTIFSMVMELYTGQVMRLYCILAITIFEPNAVILNIQYLMMYDV